MQIDKASRNRGLLSCNSTRVPPHARNAYRKAYRVYPISETADTVKLSDFCLSCHPKKRQVTPLVECCLEALRAPVSSRSNFVACISS